MLDKLKSMNKGLLIGICVGAVLVIALVVTLIVMAVTKPAEPSVKDPADTTEKVEDTTDKKEDTTEADTTAEDTTAEDTTAEDTTAEDTTVADTTAPIVTQPPVTTTPPVVDNKGSATEPYLEIPVIGTNSMSVTTVSIPAGASKFYSIQRIGGMVVTINNANAYVVCNGTRYDAQGGTLSFIAPAALASDFVTLEIGNKGGAATSFTLVFTNLVGTQANPKIIGAGTLANTQTIALAEGDSDGYNYKYYAEKAGKIRFYITATVDSVLSVTNNRNSAQRTTESDVQSDASGTYIEMEVNAGDELVIVVGAIPNKRGKYPATTINWYGKYI